MALTDWTDEASVAKAMAGCSCAVISTRYARPWAGELALAGPAEAAPLSEQKPPAQTQEEDAARLALLVRLAESSAAQHLVVLEAAGSSAWERAAAVQCLASSKAFAHACTYVAHPAVGLAGTAAAGTGSPAWTFKRGVPITPGGIAVRCAPLADALAAPPEQAPEQAPELSVGAAAVALEDYAAAIVQAIQSLPWGESRVLFVEPAAASGEGSVLPAADDDPAKVWVVGQARMEKLFRS